MPEEKQESTALQVVQPRYPMREMLTTLKEMNDPDLFKSFAKDIIEREVAAARFGQDAQLARVFASSGAFDGINGTEQGVSLAMTKIQLGRSWNMETADAMKSVFFINGRPSVEAVYLGAQMKNAGLDWDIEWDEAPDGTCTGCHLHLKRWNAETKKHDAVMGMVNGAPKQAVVSFTKKNADNAWVYESGKKIRLSEKFNYQSWGEDMYYARCVGRVRTRYMPNVLSGVLTREEAEDAGASVEIVAHAALLPPAAVATVSKQEEIGKALRERKEKKETLAAPPVTQPAPTQATLQPFPWMNAEELKQKLDVQRIRVGVKAYSDTLDRHKATTGDLKVDAPVSLTVYESLRALPDEVQPGDAF